MRIALLVYHKNAKNIYPAHWLEQFKHSILNQTYKGFEIFEVEYGNGDYRIFEESDYESKELPTFVDAMNYLLDKCFSLGYDYCLNTNVDDIFDIYRVEKQLPFMRLKIDVISSNFSLIKDDIITHTHSFENLNIAIELNRDNNVICHPVVAISKAYWKDHRYFPDQVPTEDLQLWQRGIKNGNTFVILPDVLCLHRLHSNSVCQNENNR